MVQVASSLTTTLPLSTLTRTSNYVSFKFFLAQMIICVVSVVDNFDGGISFSFSLGFRTSSCSGLLLYAHSLLFPDHVALELLNGTVSVHVHAVTSAY